jgi:chromosome segregation ATPase
MENKKTFVDETDYKALWKHSYDECEKLKETNSALTDKVEDLEQELAEVRRTLTDANDHIRRLEARIDNLIGQVDAYKYAIRYCMAGDAK